MSKNIASPLMKGDIAPVGQNYKWWVVGMLWAICFFNYADRQAFFAVFPALKAEFGFDAVQLGLLGSAFAWIYAAAAPLAGFVGDRAPRKHLILGGCLFWSGITVLTGGCGRLWQFVGVRAMTGLGESVYFPSAMSLLSDYHGRRTRSLAFSLHQSAVYIGSIGGSWLGAWLAERHGWRVGFYFFGGVGILLGLLLCRVLLEPKRGAADAMDAETAPPEDTHGVAPASAEKPLGLEKTLGMIFSKPTALLLMAVFLCANFVATIFLTWTPMFLVDKFHFGMAKAGLFGTLFISIASALSVPIGGLLADRLAVRFVGGRMCVQALGLFVGATFVVLVGLTTNMTTLLVSMTLFGLCKGLYDSNIFASLYDVIEPRARGTAAGIMNTVGWGGGALGPVAVGFATKYGRHGADTLANMSEAIAFGGVIYILGGILLVTAAIRVKRDAVHRAPAAT